MKNIHAAKPNVINHKHDNQYIINHPFTENNIIKLHKLFLTNGTHTIMVQNVITGRLIIKTILTSLQCYQNIGIATMENIPTDYDLFDIRQLVFENNYQSKQAHESLNEFFLISFQFDFIWIELSKKLDESSWFKQFEQKIKQFSLSREIPIVYVSYIH